MPNLFDYHDRNRETQGNNWMLLVALAAVVLVFIFPLFFPDQHDQYGLNQWHFLGELQARIVKVVIGLSIVFFICAVVFGPKAVQEKISPYSDELRDIMELNKIVYRGTKPEDLVTILPTINIAAMAAAINTGSRFLGICLLLAAMLRLT